MANFSRWRSFLNKNIQKEILDNHLSVWLKWEETTLIKRIKIAKKDL